MKKVVVPLSVSGIEDLRKELKTYRKWQEAKMKLLTKKLADLGVEVASVKFGAVEYVGEKNVEVTAEEIPNGYVVRASGEAVLVLEFGGGIKYGYGHPENDEFGMGPGTYPSDKGRKAADGRWYKNWEHPNGWWLPKENGGEHTYGNAPSMAMYEARKKIKQEIVSIVKEVFR